MLDTWTLVNSNVRGCIGFSINIVGNFKDQNYFGSVKNEET